MPAGSRLLTALAAAGLALTACGSGGPVAGGTGALAGRSPDDIIRLASESVQATSMRFSLDGSVSIDTSGLQNLPTRALGSLGAMSDIAIHAAGDEESPQRVSMRMSMPPVLQQPVTVVVYDGTGYVATDGTHFAQTGSVRSLTGGLGATPTDLKDYLGGLGSVQDLGAATVDGVATEHLHGTLGSDFLSRALQASGAQGQSAQMAQILSQLVQLRGGSVDAWVRTSDGRPARVSASFTMAFDLGRLGGLLGGGAPSGSAPGGSMAMTVALDMHMTDYGAAITVTRPQVDPDATVPQGLGGSLF